MFLISLRYLQERKIIPYFILNGVGVLFHSSSLIFFPMYFFLNKRPNKRFFLVGFLLGNFIYIFQIKWIKELCIFLIPFLPKFGVFRLLTTYFITADFGAFGITIGFIERSLTAIFIFCIFNRLIQDKKQYVFLNAFFIYIFVYLFFSESYILIQRIPLLFVFSYWILLPNAYNFLKREEKAIFLSFIIFYGVLKVHSLTNKNILFYDNYIFGLKMDFEQRMQIIKNYHGR